MTAAERGRIARAWQTVGHDHLAAAQSCRRAGHFRSSVSRSYYAAYAFLSAALIKKDTVSFQISRDGPTHAQLPNLIRDHLNQEFGSASLKLIRQNITALYNLRVLADYYPQKTVGEDYAIEALQLATAIEKKVGMIKG